MIVCSCNVFTDRQVRDAVSARHDIRTTSAVYRGLGCSPQCGRCARTIRTILDQARVQDAAPGHGDLASARAACNDDLPTVIPALIAAE